MERDLRRIIYDETDVPRPILAGGVLWVLLFFFPIPLMLLVHWFLRQQPPASTWLRLISVLTFGDWWTGLVGIATFSACIGLVAWLMQTSDEVRKFVQSVTDDAGLLGLRLPTLITTPLLTISLMLLRKMGVVELALMSGVEIALASAKTVNRFPEETVDLVPSDLLVDVEQLKKGQGEIVTFVWEFAPEPHAGKEIFTLKVAFSAERLEQARESDHSVNSDADLQRFVHSGLQMPEIFALASLLHEEHQKHRWTPFQRAINVLSILESFAVEEENLPKRLPIETLYERAGTSSDLVIAAATLLRALDKTVPEAVLVVSSDGKGVALGIAGAGELPKTFHGFEHAGEIYFFCLPQRFGNRWQWHVGQRLPGWENIRILPLPQR